MGSPLKHLALIVALASCAPTYHGVARVTHAKSPCPPTMLVDLDFAAVLALFVGSALAFNADHYTRAGLEAGAAAGLAFGGAAAEVACAR